MTISSATASGPLKFQPNEIWYSERVIGVWAPAAGKGEALGLKWDDVDFSASRVRIRRALVRGQLGTPKSGRARFVVLSPALAAILHDLFAQRRRECLTHGWGDVPEFVFCSEAGGRMLFTLPMVLGLQV